MAGQNRRLDDKELLAVFQDPRADLSLLDPEEHQRLLKLTEPTQAKPTVSKSGIDRAAETLPMVGGAVGGMVGGPMGAALGGAAGQGFTSLIQNATQIPGAVIDVTRNLFSQPGATVKGFAEGAMGGAKDAAIQGGVQGATEYVGGKVMSGLKAGAKAVYRGYLKPSLAEHSINDAAKVVQTALDEGLPISKAGKERAQVIIGDLKSEVDRILATPNYARKQMFGDVDLHDIANEVRAFAKKKYGRVGRPTADYEAAMQIANNIDAHPSLNIPPGKMPGPTPVSNVEANEVKRSLQQSAGEKAFGLEKTPATEAEKKGAYELRKAIELRAPEVGKLNARESALIDTAKAINHAIEREANNNALLGVKSIGAGLYGGEEYRRTGNPYTAAGKALAARIALAPANATKLAILTYRLGTSAKIAPAAAARIAMAAMAASDDQAGND